MKKIIRILTFIVVLCTVMVATTACGEEESTEIFQMDGTKIVSVTNYGKSFDTITIPADVTAIGENAFAYCTNLKELVIPISVTEINAYAFNGCTALETVTYVGTEAVPATDENPGQEAVPATINDWANITFNGFASNPMKYAETFMLNDQVVTELNLSNLTAIKDRAFYGFENLTAITLPSNLKTIGNESFLGCSSVTQLTIPSSVTAIGNYAFAYCDGITEVVVPKNVASLGANAFANCAGLTKVTIAKDSKLNKVGSFAFDNCDALTTVNYCASMDNWAKIEFANKEANPMYNAEDFQNNGTTLTEITLNSARTIAANAFYGFDNLTKITLPSKVNKVGLDAFVDCDSLTTVNFLGTMDDWAAIRFDNKEANPMAVAEEFQMKGVKVTKIELKKAQRIEKFAFRNFKDVTEVQLPASLNYSGELAFEGADNIAKVNYLGTVDQWAEVSFEDLKSNPNTIAQNFLWKGEEKTEITLTKAKKIKQYVFRGFDNLKKITIPKSVTSIEIEAFAGCTNLEEVVFVGNSGLKTIGPSAFKNCSKLTKFVIPKNVEDIMIEAFVGCDMLTIYTSLQMGDSKTAGWVSDWNKDNRPVVWEYTGE
ncbi:MAG: leucine-rich repeat domain-containing protein [Clostridiales bacterium]|nr:leucine-rich repeat domain-containing protein [Clostridiales bacterium]